MPRNIRSFETSKRTHPDVVELREQKRVDEMPAIDCKFRIIDGLLRDLQSRRPRAEKTPAAPPVELGFQLLRAGDEIRQMNPKQIMTFDHIRIPLFHDRSEPLESVALRFLNVVWIDNN